MAWYRNENFYDCELRHEGVRCSYRMFSYKKALRRGEASRLLNGICVNGRWIIERIHSQSILAYV
jgi:hypothetical protein